MYSALQLQQKLFPTTHQLCFMQRRCCLVLLKRGIQAALEHLLRLRNPPRWHPAEVEDQGTIKPMKRFDPLILPLYSRATSWDIKCRLGSSPADPGSGRDWNPTRRPKRHVSANKCLSLENSFLSFTGTRKGPRSPVPTRVATEAPCHNRRKV